MFHRAAATTAAILAPFGVALAVPVVTHTGGVPAAQAGADNGSPADNLTDENLPAPSPPPAPVPSPPPAPPVTPPAPTPVLPPLPPKPQDTLQDSGSPSSGVSPGGGSGNGSSGNGSSDKGTHSERLSVALSNTRTVSDTGAIPQGGVQAGGGGTAPSLRDAGSSDGALGAAAGLVILVTGTGLALRRRLGVTAE
jgi:hypothetical protein